MKEKIRKLIDRLKRQRVKAGSQSLEAGEAPTPDAADVGGDNYLDELAGTRVQLRRWKSFAVWQTVATVPLVGLVVFLTVLNIKNVDRTQVILSPAVERFEVATVNQVTDSYIKAAFEHVALRNSSWTYETLEENYEDLFAHYYSQDLATRTRANLMQTGRFDYVKKNRMISTFKIDRERSEYTWCAALNLACGIVVGREATFIDGNQPFNSTDVAYLVFSESIFPTKTNPFALRITRLVIGDYDSLKKALAAAKEGRLPDEIQSKTAQR